MLIDGPSDPPEVTKTAIKIKDLPVTVPWDDSRLPIDFLLLTVEDCEFLSCLSYLNSSFCKTYCKELGYVYFGELGRGEMKIRIAVRKCHKGAIAAGGSAVSVSPAVRVLRPKAVFLVGICHSLKSSEVKLGDVAISEKLITCVPSSDEVGDKVPLNSLLLKLTPNAADGWKAPLKDPEALTVEIHRGNILSIPGVIDNNECRKTLIKRFPQAIAMELEGQGKHIMTYGDSLRNGRSSAERETKGTTTELIVSLLMLLCTLIMKFLSNFAGNGVEISLTNLISTNYDTLINWKSEISPHVRRIQDSLGFWIPRRGFHIPGTGFQSIQFKVDKLQLIVVAKKYIYVS